MRWFRYIGYFWWVFVIAVLSGLVACTRQSGAPAARQTSVDIEAWPRAASPLQLSAPMESRIDTLLATMTLEEKVGQIMQAEIQSITPQDVKTWHIGAVLSGAGSMPNRIDRATAADWLEFAQALYDASVDKSGGRAGIPVVWGVDAVHGHNSAFGATIFPHNISLGAANDPELVRLIGEATAAEVVATGLKWVFAPTLAVARDDRWGRTFESYSEDPALVQRYAGAMIEGLQGRAGQSEFLDQHHVIATAKHFLGDGGTFGGDDQGDTRTSEEELVRIHSPGYPAAVHAGVQSVMASFSSWNGAKMHGNHYLLTDVLKNRFGFDGLVVGDWNGHGQLPDCTNESCPAAINAGIDLVMVTYDWKPMIENTLAQLRRGEISVQRLDDAVRRILRVKLRAGLFESGPRQLAGAGDQQVLGSAAHRALARRAVRESLVLLKNHNHLLPLKPRQRVLLAGDGADNIGMQCGGWSVNWQGTQNNADFPGGSSVYQEVRRVVEAAGGESQLSVDGTYRVKPDVAIVVYGEAPYAEGHGDINTLEFEAGKKANLQLLQRLKAAGIPAVSIFLSGRPLWVNPQLNASDAFVAAWLPGSEGAGIADVLFADADGRPRFDFQGRLAFSWPRTPQQFTLNVNDDGYDPLFAWGYGLDYASGREGPGQLEENVAGLSSSEPQDIVFYNGRALEPWHVFIKNSERTQILSGAFSALPQHDVEIVTSDKDLQEDALTMTWHDARGAGVYLDADRSLDLSRHLPAGALAFDLKVEAGFKGDLKLVLYCGDGCERRLPLSDTARTNAGEGWQALTVRLSCLAQDGDSFAQLNRPFMLEANGSGQLSVANVRFLLTTDAPEDCPR